MYHNNCAQNVYNLCINIYPVHNTNQNVFGQTKSKSIPFLSPGSYVCTPEPFSMFNVSLSLLKTL